jgi:3-hydroxybutyryl-CoA dehydrogenase
MITAVAVCGAGTMGSGIAQVAAHSGFNAILFDLNEVIIEKAKAGIQKNLQFLLDKQKISADQKEEIYNRITFTSDIKLCKADLIIEAIIEKMEAKVSLFNQLAEINNEHTIFATNTSSISVTDLQKQVAGPERVAGMHFFNPAPLMKLVEVVKGEQTSDDIAKVVYEVCKKMGKTPVMCKDAPGFIVNRVARHYYLEAMKLVEQGAASFESVDAIMEATGFKMGPFKLMDLIGMDINLSVSQGMYEAFDHVDRFKPSDIQIEKVKNGELGRKTGKGFYEYPKPS